MARLFYAIVTMSLLATAQPTLAQSTEPAIAECAEAVGTYMTRRVNEGVSGPESVGRSLLSLTNGGHAMFTDSAQGGVEGYQPFSDAKGGWRCLNTDAGKYHFEALVFDFTFPTETEPNPKIARVDILATFNPANGAVTGSASVAFAPLNIDDPMDRNAFEVVTGYNFTGSRVKLAD